MPGNGDREKPARGEHAAGFGHKALGVRHVLEHVHANDRIEACVAEGQPAVRRRRCELELGMRPPGSLERHRRGVDPGCLGTGPGEQCREPAVSAAEIENPRRGVPLSLRIGDPRGLDREPDNGFVEPPFGRQLPPDFVS